MTHLDEEDFLALHRGEMPLPGHLAGCPQCREDLALLEEALGAVPDPFAQSDPGDDYGLRTAQALAGRLRPARRAPVWVRWGGLAASVLLAFLAGRVTAPIPEPVPAAAAARQVRERVLLVAVGRHLERSRIVLAELENAVPGEPLALDGLRRSAQDLRGEGRLYRAAAERDGEVALASVIEELGRVLTEVANAPDELGPDDLSRLQKRIEDRGLLFKLQVLGRDLGRRAGSPAPATSVS